MKQMKKPVLLISLLTLILCGCSKEVEEEEENLWPEPSIYNQSLIDAAFDIVREKHPEEKEGNLRVERIYYGKDTGSIRASEFVEIRILRLDQRFLTPDRKEKYNAESLYYRVRFKPNGELEQFSRAGSRLSLSSHEYEKALELGFTIKDD